MDAIDAVESIKQRFANTGNPTLVPLLKHGDFIAELVTDGVRVSNLGTQPLLPWAVFQETVALLIRNGGRAARGDAMGAKLGLLKGSFIVSFCRGFVEMQNHDSPVGGV